VPLTSDPSLHDRVPTVSVVIPCYKQAQFLNESVGSTLAQTFADFECLIVNDGSPDNTREVALTLCGNDGRVRYVEQENQGLAGARNRGIREARAPLIQFLDADDLLAPEKLASQVELLQQRTGASVVFCDFACFSDHAPSRLEPSPLVFRQKAQSPDVWAALLAGNFIVVHSALIRKSALLEVGGFDASLPACEDYDLWLRLVAAGLQLTFQDATLALYRRHDASMSQNSVAQLRATLRALEKVPTYARMGGQHREIWRRHQASLRCALATALVKCSGATLEALAESMRFRTIGLRLSLANLAAIGALIVRQAYARHIGWRLHRGS
jgi:glycosyltransferase involved in cell wall biosynthesis